MYIYIYIYTYTARTLLEESPRSFATCGAQFWASYSNSSNSSNSRIGSGPVIVIVVIVIVIYIVLYIFCGTQFWSDIYNSIVIVVYIFCGAQFWSDKAGSCTEGGLRNSSRHSHGLYRLVCFCLSCTILRRTNKGFWQRIEAAKVWLTFPDRRLRNGTVCGLAAGL